MSFIDTSRYRIRPNADVVLAKIDTKDPGDFEGDKGAGRAAQAKLNDRLEELQELLYAEGKHRLLVVLQATDTGGKDGTIRRVFDGVNPQGVKVASFKKPTAVELSHDYLWRIHAQTPADGQIVIFNRSHYEDVLVVRVHDIVPEKRWRKRYGHINAFEEMLSDEGTTILKFFLHISKDEQAERLQARLDEPAKHWKFALGDLEERKHWDEYQAAFQDMIRMTSTESAPWYVIPADRKWLRDLIITSVLVETLEGFSMRYPENEDDLTNVVIE